MAEAEKIDMTQSQSDGSREAGAGIGLSRQGPSTESLFLDAAAAQLEALDAGDRDDDERPRRRKKPAAPPPEIDEELDVDDDEELDEVDEDDDEDDAPAKPAKPSDDDEDEDDEDDDGPKVSVRVDGKKATLEDVLPYLTATVKVNGEDVEVDGSELLKGYQRNYDYTKKTMALQQEVSELQPYAQMVAYAKEDPQFINYVQSYFQNGPYPELANNPDLKVTNDQLARMLDPNSPDFDQAHASQVLKARSAWEQKSGERQQVNQRTMQRMQEMRSQYAQQQIAAAQHMIDALGDPPGEDGVGEYQRKSEQVLATVRAAGFNDAELQGLSPLNALDARLAVMAYKASEYDRLKQETEAPRVSLGKKRKHFVPPRSQAPGSGKSKASSRKRVRDSAARATKTQRSEDWTTAIANRLKL